MAKAETIFSEKSCLLLRPTNPLRKFTIKTVTSRWFERVSIGVILANSLTLALVDYCDLTCSSVRCRILGIAEHVIFIYFTIEMFMKMLAMGVYGRGSYLNSGWNRFDCFIVVTGMAEYVFVGNQLNITAIRTLRILRPLRAITRISSLRLLVAWILASLPLLGNVLLFFTFIFFIFAIVSVQLWAGMMRQRCFFPAELFNGSHPPPNFLPSFYQSYDHEFICSNAFGYLTCDKISQIEEYSSMCTRLYAGDVGKMTECQKWVGNYTECRASGENPVSGTNFDNIGVASVTIFEVISLHGWTHVMYLVQDVYSFWSWTFFVSIVLIASYFAAKLCMVVVVAQFSVTLHKEKRKRKKDDQRKNSSGQMTDSSHEEHMEDVAAVYEEAVNAIFSYFRRKRQSKLGNPDAAEEASVSRFSTQRAWLRKLLERTFVQVTISSLIFLNAVIMGTEHHNQSAFFKNMLEIANIIFTVVFILELILRAIAVGLQDFVREPLNMLDSIVLLINFVDILSQDSNLPGVSVLRMFRLMRVVKILRYFPALQTQLLLMLHAIASATIFFALFIFVVFISALLGMSLFSCRPCANHQTEPIASTEDNTVLKPRTTFTFSLGTIEKSDSPYYFSDQSNLITLIVPLTEKYPTANQPKIEDEETLCKEERFNGVFHSMFTVLQIFTRDSWTDIMKSSTSYTSKWASIYFIFLVTVGSYCVFNILAGILVQGFSVKSEETVKLRHKISKKSKAKKTRNNRQESQTSAVKQRLDYCFSGCGTEKSLFLFSVDGAFRSALIRFLATKYFDAFTMFVTLSTFVVIIFEKPSMDPDGLERKAINIANYVISVLFTMEAAAKIIAKGLLLGEDTFLRNGWNVLDFVLVLLAGSELLAKVVFHDTPDSVAVKGFRLMRLIRTLRPLRLISRSTRLRNVLKSLLLSFKPITNIVLICAIFFCIFGILGVQLFKGCFARCVIPDLGLEHRNATLTTALSQVNNREDCLNNGLEWQKDHNNFDNLKNGLEALFVVAMEDSWATLTYNASRCVGPDIHPTGEIRSSAYVYFVSFVFVVRLFALNLFVGVVVNTFQKVQVSKKVDKEKKKGVVEKEKPAESFLQNYSIRRLLLYRIVTHRFFEIGMLTIVSINVGLLAIEHYEMDRMTQFILNKVGMIFLAFLVLEILLKVSALGPSRYLHCKWNVADALITILSLAGVIMENLDDAILSANPSVVRIARVFRIIRAVKLIKAAKTLRRIMKTMSNAVPQVLNLSVLFGLLFFVYGSVGVQLYGKLKCDTSDECHGISRHSNFENFGMAVLTLFRIFTGDGWNEVQNDIDRMSGHKAFCTGDKGIYGSVPCSFVHHITPIYFMSFMLLSQFILINIVIAVLMEQISALSKAQLADLETSSVVASSIDFHDITEPLYQTPDRQQIPLIEKDDQKALATSGQKDQITISEDA